jgi:hypothetical protein
MAENAYADSNTYRLNQVVTSREYDNANENMGYSSIRQKMDCSGASQRVDEF